MIRKKLNIQWFIEQNSDWEKILSEKPYCIHIQRDTMFGRRLILFKYDQIESDFNEILVRECRGLILDEDTLEPVCVPFFKFFNAGETHADEIDWNTAWTAEKIDGSIIKVVRMGDDLLISTNGTIDAYKAKIQDQIGFVGGTFGSLFEKALANAQKAQESGKATMDWVILPKDWLRNMLSEGFTYMFELTSPYNKVVCNYPTIDAWFIGCRNNETMEEYRFFEHNLSKIFKTPEVFLLGNLKQVEAAAEKLDCNHEGFVVCDGNFHRVKQKSTQYVALHHMKNNGVLSFERGVDIVRYGELDEVLSYFPEFSEHLLKIKDDFDNMISTINNAWCKFNAVKDKLQTRKEQAMMITNKDCFGKFSGVGFALLDGKISSVDEWINKTPSKSIVKFLGYKE